MPKTEKIILSSEELRFLGKLFKKVFQDRTRKKTLYIPEKFNEKYPDRKVSFKVLERCYNQDETINSNSDIEIDSDNDISAINATGINAVNSSIKSSISCVNGKESVFFEDLLVAQRDHNEKLNNYRKHPEFYKDANVYENFI